MRDMTPTFVLLLGACVAAAASDHGRMRHVPLGKSMVLSGPKSRFLGSGNGSNIPADGSVWPTAIYWCYVEIGTPPQEFPAAIDSGSGNLNIAGKDCDGCVTKSPNNGYNPDASSSSSTTFPRKFSLTYETCNLKDPTDPCTISGNRYNDMVSLAGFGPVSVTLGSIQTQTDNFDQFKQIDGVIGFTQGGSSNVFAQLVGAGLVDNVWAMCMYEGSTSNGTLTIGGVDERLADGPITYVPDVGSSFHSVNVVSFILRGKAAGGLRLPVADAPTSATTTVPVGKAAILDTGTNVLLLRSHYLAKLRAAVCADAGLASCGDLWDGTCLSLTEEEVDAYPDLALELDGGLLLEMTSRDYLLKGSPLADEGGQYCIGIKDGGTNFIIGDTTMRHYYLVFDYANERVGWGAVNTETCGSL